MPDVFSIPIFFIVFREALEAAIVIAVLFSLVEAIVVKQPSGTSTPVSTQTADDKEKDAKNGNNDNSHDTLPEEAPTDRAALLKKLRLQIFAGAGAGLFIALAIGAAFIAVWFTQVRDLFGANEEIWEGVFNLIAAILIFVMALTMLRMDTAKARWKAKIEAAFAAKSAKADGEGKSVKYLLFTIPFITVLREGLEAVVFIGGVSLGQNGTAIPLAAIVGLLVGIIIGFIIYKSSSRLGLSIFLIISTWFLLLIGAGLFSKSVGNFQRHKFNTAVGGDVAEAGSGPGSYSTNGSIWHLNCCNPEDKFGDGGWAIFSGLFGWSNDGNIGTVLSYILYWWTAIAALVFMKYREGRLRKTNRVRA